MRVFRLLVDLGHELRTYLVAADTHLDAWRAILAGLNAQERAHAALEELEAGRPHPGRGPAEVLNVWRGGAPAPPLAA